MFKKKQEKSWRACEGNDSQKIEGYFIADWDSKIEYRKCPHSEKNRNLFATEKQAKSALAMSQISQILESDPRFGGPITNGEWRNSKLLKCVICRYSNTILSDLRYSTYEFPAFHTKEQRDLFLEENEDFVRDYLMLD